ncbi:uncharacterized protein BT62DRAFT_960763 [Guyanagaster necrorhizus]|uniref:Uncharacterized protein n=1 Tax=Guyanagaster necrorhizus TaxID=856835 RepID=A0A9P7W0N9_9AGAR|nr:uncharacterized protein BT62DRAFT_960763 [Guyanagaster necrorhizus MCA 3950]KAG7451141.1 hypothetical protein BT62DRAFT_960763 [Guyanagaster necrorhizus MCA 3950]
MEHNGAPGFPPTMPQMPQPHFDQLRAMSGGYQASIQQPPSSGFRIPLHSSSAFPQQDHAGPPPCHDLDGSPVYIGSAIFDKSVHPCKIGPHLHVPCSVAYGGSEVGHKGRYDLLPFTPDTMEFVRTSQGHVPAGRRPIEGGYEEDGSPLYHAVAIVNGIRVPGKTGAHLGGCNVSFGGGEHTVRDNYEILCVHVPSFEDDLTICRQVLEVLGGSVYNERIPILKVIVYRT